MAADDIDMKIKFYKYHANNKGNPYARQYGKIADTLIELKTLREENKVLKERAPFHEEDKWLTIFGSTGLASIALERKKQCFESKYTKEYDDQWTKGELAIAAACYAASTFWGGMQLLWPWSLRCWKPSPNNRRHELVQAGALIAAEIDRLDRRGYCVKVSSSVKARI